LNNAIVIIPTYNEKENITMIIDTVFSLPKDFDILIVDDNSPDGTAEIVKDLQRGYNSGTETRLHLMQRPGKQGLGTAYIQGFKYALQTGYDFVLQMDADFSHNPKDLINLYLNCSEWGKRSFRWFALCHRSKCGKLADGARAAFVLCEQVCATRYGHSAARYHCRICLLQQQSIKDHSAGRGEVCWLRLSDRNEIS
jgi:glycosyltransferase involved in cell wall biosynthesis